MLAQYCGGGAKRQAQNMEEWGFKDLQLIHHTPGARGGNSSFTTFLYKRVADQAPEASPVKRKAQACVLKWKSWRDVYDAILAKGSPAYCTRGAKKRRLMAEAATAVGPTSHR